MTTKCRVWWPNEIVPSSSLSSNLALFGWFISNSPACFDVVVAFAYREDFLAVHSDLSAFQVAINYAHESMPIRLQDRSNLTLLGRCVVPSKNVCMMCKLNKVNGNHKQPLDSIVASHNESDSSVNSYNWNCGSLEDDRLFRQYENVYTPNSAWIQLVQDGHTFSSYEKCLIPTLHHLHRSGKMSSSVELHVMVYEIPRYRSHYFSISLSDSECTTFSSKRPQWIDELHQKPQLIDLDNVIVAINSSAAAKIGFDKHLLVQSSSTKLSVLRMLVSLLWRLFAAAVATLSTLLYIILQSFHKLAGYGSKFRISGAVANIFSNTLINFQLQCHQILYWPIYLNDSALRSQACVEFLEKAALRRHSLWSAAMVDVTLGNLLGYALLSYTNTVCSFILNFATQFTDDVLRTGCVWLMGVPAGFKLNTELAGVLGSISLNAIQIWSTLWFLAAHILYDIIMVIALLGILLGITVAAALVLDIIAMAAFHIHILREFVGFFYSLQIEALTSLWRLFRGRKWNPLRQRLDSYEYSVEQHVVGSLMFSPLLLLLPTTSVFYIFFAIMSMTILFVRTAVQIVVSVIHDTPYAKIVLWLVRPKRFPSGIWFEIMDDRRDSVSSSMAGPVSWNSVILPLVLRSNIMTLGQVISPHYKNFFSRIHGPSFASAVSGILTGKSITPQETATSWKRPQMSISYKEYWYICYRAVLACMQ